MTAAVPKERRSLRANVIVNLVRTLTMTILSFLTFPFITRALQDQVYGLYTWANTFVYYFLVLARISIPNIAIRECAKVKDNKEALSAKAQQFFIIQAITTLLSFGFMCSLIFTIPALRSESSIIFLLSINFLLGLFSFEWIYIALEKHVYITIRSVSLIALSAMLTFVVIKPTTTVGSAMNELYIYAAITISPTILTSIINVIYLRKFITFKKTMPYDFKSILKSLWVLFLISLFLTAYNQTDSFMLGFLDQEKRAVGSYSVGVKGIDILITIITSTYTVFMPRASRLYEAGELPEFRKLAKYGFHLTAFVAIPAVATLSTMAVGITSLFSGSNENSYVGSAEVLMSLSAMVLTYSICDNIYTNVLIPQKREKVYLIAMVVGLVLNVGLSLLFGALVFKDKPAFGVALATMITDVIVLTVLIALSGKVVFKALFTIDNLKLLIVGVIIGVASYFLYPLFVSLLPWGKADQYYWASELLSIIFVIIIDAVVYIGLLRLLRESLTSTYIKGRRKDA